MGLPFDGICKGPCKFTLTEPRSQNKGWRMSYTRTGGTGYINPQSSQRSHETKNAILLNRDSWVSAWIKHSN